MFKRGGGTKEDPPGIEDAPPPGGDEGFAPGLAGILDITTSLIT
jgi:hypothetical protein